MKKTIMYIVNIILIGIIFQGCAKSIPMETKNKIKTIEINKIVGGQKGITLILSKEIKDVLADFYQGKNIYVEDRSISELRTSLSRYIYKNANITEVYNASLEKYLKNSNYFNNKLVSKNGDYILKSYISMYGLVFDYDVFPIKYKPTIYLEIKLFDKNRDVVWSDSSYLSSMNGGTSSYLLKEYIDNPEFLRKALREASDILIKSLLSNFE